MEFKRYALVMWEDYYPSGGMGNVVARGVNKDELLEDIGDCWESTYCEIFDLYDWEVVAEIKVDYNREVFYATEQIKKAIKEQWKFEV